LNFDHPAFAPYRALIDTMDLARDLPLPGPGCLDALNTQAASLDTRHSNGLPLRFFVPDERLSARDYETPSSIPLGFRPGPTPGTMC